MSLLVETLGLEDPFNGSDTMQNYFIYLNTCEPEILVLNVVVGYVFYDVGQSTAFIIVRFNNTLRITGEKAMFGTFFNIQVAVQVPFFP